MAILTFALSALLAASIATLCLLNSRLRRRIGAMENAAREERERVEAILRTVNEAIDCLNQQVRDAAERAGVLVAPVPPRSGLNLGKRSQALRLHGHGETVDKIAVHLDLPRADVKLLLKIHEAVLKRSQEA